MTAVAPNTVLSAANPVLACWISSAFGILCAPDSLAWRIDDVSTDDKSLSPAAVASGSVDLDADRVTTGRYAVAWTVPAQEALGRHRLTWTATITSTDADGNATTRTLTWSREFDVLAAVQTQPGYITVSDMRDEGVTLAKVSDARLIKLIHDASIYFDRATARHFEPRPMEFKLDGSGRPALPIEAPIVAIEQAAIFGEGLIDPSHYRVFNRHLAGMRTPDDRAQAKLEFFVTQPGLQGPMQPLSYPYPISSAWAQAKPWTKGSANVTVSGVFGYTDPDGSCEGETPSEVRRAVRLLVMRSLPKLTREQDRFDAINRHRITEERTREQTYRLGPGRAVGDFTGDMEIDGLIEQFSRPPQMYAV